MGNQASSQAPPPETATGNQTNKDQPARVRTIFDPPQPAHTPPPPIGDGVCRISPKATPFVIDKNFSCAPHFYCPNTNPKDPLSLPSVCPPEPQCQIMRLTGQFCPAQGLYEPAPCDRGFFCPDFLTQTTCPSGTFCPYGRTEPIACPPLFSNCPEKSIKRVYYGGLVFCAIIDAFLLLLYLFLRWRHRGREQKRERETVRRQKGLEVGTIAETRHTKKQAQFMTLDDVEEMEMTPLDDELEDGKAADPDNGSIKKNKRLINPGLPRKLWKQVVDWWNGDTVQTIDLNHVGTRSASTPPPFPRHTPSPVISAPIINGVNNAHLPNFPPESISGGIRAPSPALSANPTQSSSQQQQHYSVHLNDLLIGFRRAQNDQDLSLRLQFDQLSLQLSSGKHILQGVSGQTEPGRVTVIMGPSGAGKSTFMRVLMGKLKRTGGSLRINGRLVEMHNYKKLIGYVPQDDIMLMELTVRENIAYSAHMRLPRSWSWKERERFVDTVLESLELSHVADHLITNISGGQRKRVNIGMELVACPSLLFLDEPTSGLDATAALKVTLTMKKIASSIGLTVVSVVHQPRYEIYEEFDDLLLIAPGGLTAYIGPRACAQLYFEEYLGFRFDPRNNPADTLMDILSAKGELTQRKQHSTDQLMGVDPASTDYEVMELVHWWKEYQLNQKLIAIENSSPFFSSSSGAITAIHSRSDSPLLHQHGLASIPEELELCPRNQSSGLLFIQEFDDDIRERESEKEFSDDDTTTHSSYASRGTSSSHRLPVIPDNESVPAPPETPPPNAPVPQSQNVSAKTMQDMYGDEGASDDAKGSSSHQILRQACLDRGANWLQQLWYVHQRSVLQQYRRIGAFVLELGVGLMTGLVMGLAVSGYDGQLYQGLLVPPYTIVSPAPIELVIPILSLIIGCAIGLAGAPAGVKIFSEEKEIYWREMASGYNPLSYFFGKNMASTYRILLSSLHFTSIFFYLASPNISFWKLWGVHLLQFYCVYGMSFAVAMLVKRENASLAAVCMAVVMAALCGDGPTLRTARTYGFAFLLEMSFDRWAAEAWYSEELLVFQGVFTIDLSADHFGYTLNRYGWDIFWLVMIGLIWRAIAFLLLVGLNRQKQRRRKTTKMNCFNWILNFYVIYQVTFLGYAIARRVSVRVGCDDTLNAWFAGQTTSGTSFWSPYEMVADVEPGVQLFSIKCTDSLGNAGLSATVAIDGVLSAQLDKSGSWKFTNTAPAANWNTDVNFDETGWSGVSFTCTMDNGWPQVGSFYDGNFVAAPWTWAPACSIPTSNYRNTVYVRFKVVVPPCPQNANCTLSSLACNPGFSYRQIEAPCIPCSAGSFKNSSGNTGCTMCPNGTYQLRTGQSSCIDCPENAVCNTAGLSLFSCNSGFTINSLRQQCDPCPAGTFKSSVGNQNCTACPVGTYQPSTGKTSCKLCPSNSTCNQTSLISFSCNPGFYNVTETSCSLCAFGSFCFDGISRKCGPNSDTKSLGSKSVSDCICDPGYYGQNSSCQICPIGSYCPGGLLPQSCGANSNSSGKGTTNKSGCLCNAGYYLNSSLDNDQSCTACPIGSYKSVLGNEPCSYCPANSSCTSMASPIFECNPGFYLDSATFNCRPCPSGSYKPEIGNLPCTSCPLNADCSTGKTFTCMAGSNFDSKWKPSQTPNPTISSVTPITSNALALLLSSPLYLGLLLTSFTANILLSIIGILLYLRNRNLGHLKIHTVSNPSSEGTSTSVLTDLTVSSARSGPYGSQVISRYSNMTQMSGNQNRPNGTIRVAGHPKRSVERGTGTARNAKLSHSIIR